MKRLTIALPERLFDLLERMARAAGARTDDLVTDLVVDALLIKEKKEVDSDSASGVPAPEVLQTPSSSLRGPDTWHSGPSQVSPVSSTFSVKDAFPERSPATILKTQRFVDEALSYRGVRAFKNKDGIGFDPNFVFIERVYSEEDGFSVSFYGSPEDFARHGLNVLPGRGASYSRFKVKADHDLNLAIKALHISASMHHLTQRD